MVHADSDYQDDETYSYDENGNRTNTGYVVDPNNLTTSDGTYTYLYDAEGNRTARFVDGQSSGAGHGELSSGDTDITEYAWDYRNRLITITSRDSYGGDIEKLVEYTYDPLNRRIAKSIDLDGDGSGAAQETFFIHDGYRAARDGAGDHVVLQLDGTGAIKNRYLYGSAIDQILADEDSLGDVLWPLADNLATVRDLVSYNSSEDIRHPYLFGAPAGRVAACVKNWSSEARRHTVRCESVLREVTENVVRRGAPRPRRAPPPRKICAKQA